MTLQLQPVHNRDSVCALTSGLDSCILVHHLRALYDRIFPVYVRCGLIWEETELSWLQAFLTETRFPKLMPLTALALPVVDLYSGHWSATGVNVPDSRTLDEAVFLPGRNVLLLAKSAVFCALNDIHFLALADLSTNPFPDATEAFFTSMQEALSHGLGHHIEVIRPFAQMCKPEVLHLGRSLPLHLTFSCVNPRDGVHCGVCNKCHERRQAFADSGLKDMTVYRADIAT